MDIDLLSKMVKELILDNDRVVLPGLGSFVAEIVPSTFSDRGYTINPPYRRLFFRSKPDEGDMLISFYAESNGVEPDLAERIIKDFIGELKSVLHSKKTVVFPGLGRLRATKENNIFFVADEDLDIYPAGFGLEPISLKTHEETRQEVTAAVESLKEIMEEPVEELEAPIDIELEDDLVPMDWNESVESDQEQAGEEVVSEGDAELVAEDSSEVEVPVEEEVLPEQDVIVPELDADEAVETVPEHVEEEPLEDVADPQPSVEDEMEEVVDPQPSVEDELEEVVDPQPWVEDQLEEVTDQEPVVEVQPEEAAVVESVLDPDAEEESDNTDELVVKEPVPEPVVDKKSDKWTKVLKVAGIVVASLIFILVIYMAVMRLFPDFLNEVLYSPEELEIIKFK